MGPYLGVHGAPWVCQKRTLRISPFSSKICLTQLPSVLRDRLAGTPKLVYGGPCMKKVLGGLLYCPQTPHNHYGTLPWGPQGTLDLAKANLEKFDCFPAKFALPNARAGAHSGFLRPPKPACGGPCGQKSAGRPSIPSQDSTQSLWDPTVGSLGHPGSGKTQLGKISLFSSRICPTKRAHQRAQRFFATPKPARRGPCGQTNAWMPPTVPRHYTISMGPHLGLGLAK